MSNTDTFTVATPVNDYITDMKLTDMSDITRFFRMLFDEGRKQTEGEAWQHSDDVIADIIRRNADELSAISDDEEREEYILDQMDAFEPQTLPDATAMDRIEEEAKSVDQLINQAAAILNLDEALGQLLQSLDEASKLDYMGPVHVHVRLRELVKQCPELHGLLPEPGSTKDSVQGTNEPFDKYTKTVVSSSGGRRVKVFSRIEEIAKNLAITLTAKKHSDEYKAKMTDKQAIAWNSSLKSAEDKTVNLIKRHFKLAVGLYHRFNQCDAFKTLSVKYFMTTENKAKQLIRTTSKPISIYDKDNAVEKQGAYSVVQFVSMRPRKAMQAMIDNPSLNAYDALIASIEGREPREPQSAYPEAKKIEDMQVLTNSFTSSLMNVDMFRQCLKEISNNPGGEFASALVSASTRIETLLEVKQASAKKTKTA